MTHNTHLYGKAAIYAVNHYTHLYGSTVIKANRIRSMVNSTLEVRVKYPLYIVIYCKRVHHTTDSLVWGLLRLAPIIYHFVAKQWVHLI